MTTLAETTRNNQNDAFQHAGIDPEDPLVALTNSLYDQIDVLPPEQRTILVTDCFERIMSAMHDIVHETSDAHTRAVAVSLTSLLAVAGYTVESERERLGYTSTGDKRVDGITDTVRDMLAAQAKALMTPEQRKQSDIVEAAVKSRVAAGEDFEHVLHDEASKVGWTLEDDETPEAQDDPLKGLYL